MSKYPFEVQTEDVQPLSVLSPEGEIVNPDLMPELTDEQLKEIMYRMCSRGHGTSVPSTWAAKAASASMRRYPVKKLLW